MRKFTNLLVSLLALFGTVISARADLIAEPITPAPSAEPSYTWVVILVIIAVIVAIALLRRFHKK